ncbi:hypothetical protein B0T24DRAFT_267529 [Lasiosphaeria ovina]|uniref:Uncharacterized protein n=1 Tax=Lasiosphaeria ovina TaxID=92902 RepID=A0AAE0KB46_9PEZI|nr:hypothetical protein B0T24DRAFT_267529 [Lasiosphaeria ovina]
MYIPETLIRGPRMYVPRDRQKSRGGGASTSTVDTRMLTVRSASRGRDGERRYHGAGWVAIYLIFNVCAVLYTHILEGLGKSGEPSLGITWALLRGYIRLEMSVFASRAVNCCSLKNKKNLLFFFFFGILPYLTLPCLDLT